MAASIEDLLNQALRRLGNETPIGYIYEGSMPARAALEIYGQTRDDMLRAKDWSFAKRYTGAVWNGQTAPQPWLFEYAWPADCLKVRYVMPAQVGTFPVLDPRPQLFTDFNENHTSPTTKAILANVSPATIVYTGQVTDLATWDANFTEAVVEALARRLAVAITHSGDMVSGQEQLTSNAVGIALGSQVNQPPLPTQAMSEPRQQR